MSKLKKLFEKIKNNPKQVRFEELDKILMHYGFTKRLFLYPYQPHIKSVYVERVIDLLEGVMSDEQNA